MDAIKFLNEYKRMCNTLKCVNCPACTPDCDCILSVDSNTPPEEKIKIIENWSNEHPAKTRQSVFLEQYPEARIRSNGALSVCPAIISAAYRADDGGCLNSSKGCGSCCLEFWMKEVE